MRRTTREILALMLALMAPAVLAAQEIPARKPLAPAAVPAPAPVAGQANPPLPAPPPTLQKAPPTHPGAPPAGAPVQLIPASKAPAKSTAKSLTNDPKAIELINRYLEAIGGVKALEAIEDKTLRFRVVKHAASGDTVAAMNQFLKKGYRIREEWDIQGLKIKDRALAFVQVYNGVDGWVQMFGTVSPLEGKTLGLFVWDKLLDDSFCHWQEDGYTVTHGGEKTFDNDPCEVVELTDFGNSGKKQYYFSKKTGLLLKLEWREQGQNGMALKETVFKKYTKIGFSDKSGRSVLLPLVQEIYEDKDLDTSREYSEITINKGLDDKIFERPEGEEFKGAIGGGSPVPPTPPLAAPVPAGGHPVLGGGHPAVKSVPAAAPAAAPKKDLPAAAPTPPPEKKN